MRGRTERLLESNWIKKGHKIAERGKEQKALGGGKWHKRKDLIN